MTGLTWPQRVTRRLILQEARRQTCPPPRRGHCPSTACKHTVSGSFNSPHRGTFHLSLTVLVHYRSSRVFSLGKWASRIPTGLACPVVLKDSKGRPGRFRLRGFHPLCPDIPDRSANGWLGNSLGPLLWSPLRLPTPALQRQQPITQGRFGLIPFRSPLLRECFLFLVVVRCFSSHRAPRLAYRFS